MAFSDSTLQAFNYRTNGEVYEEFLVSLEAGLFNRAHGIVVDRLASEAILREDVAVLERLLEKLPDEAVDEWDEGGGVSEVLLLKALDLSSVSAPCRLRKSHGSRA